MAKQRRFSHLFSVGFSLVEVAVVVIVVAMLAGVAVATFLPQRDSAHDRAAQTNLITASKQARGYYLRHGSFGPGGGLPDNWDADWVRTVDVTIPHPSVACLSTLSKTGTRWSIVLVPDLDFSSLAPPQGMWFGVGDPKAWCDGFDGDYLERIVSAYDADGDGVADGNPSLPPLSDGFDSVVVAAEEPTTTTSPPTTTTTTTMPPTTTTAPPPTTTIPPTTTTTTPPPPPPPPSNPYEEFNIFALGGASCSPTLAINTATRTIEGSLHSNGSIESHGSGGNIEGAVTYVGSLNAWPLSQFAGGVSQADPIAFDAPWSLSDYAPGSEKEALADVAYFHHQYGLNSAVNAIAPGLHFVEGNVNIWPGAAGSVNLEGVTIVTAGNIQMSGPNVSFTPWDPDGIVLFANSGGTPSCWAQAVNASTSSLRRHLRTQQQGGVLHQHYYLYRRGGHRQLHPDHRQPSQHGAPLTHRETPPSVAGSR